MQNSKLMKKVVYIPKNEAQTGSAPAQQIQAEGAVDAASLPTEYEGIGYSAIVKARLQAMGIYGEPAEGNRNVVLYKLAREMRYICDFRTPLLMAVIPSWGLSDKERIESINSAVNSPRGTEIPGVLRDVLERLKRNGKGEDEEGAAAVDDVNPIPSNLPRLLRIFVKRNPRNQKAALLGCMPVLACLLSRLRAEYRDGREESPIFMTVVVGPQASGKSFLKEIYDRLGAPMLESDRQQAEA